jgi:hypothetical protein
MQAGAFGAGLHHDFASPLNFQLLEALYDNNSLSSAVHRD